MAAALRTVFCKNLFAGKVAIVTGGGTGIGKAITKELVRLGCRVVIASRKFDVLKEAAKEINLDVAELVSPFECNIRNEDQVCFA